MTFQAGQQTKHKQTTLHQQEQLNIFHKITRKNVTVIISMVTASIQQH